MIQRETWNSLVKEGQRVNQKSIVPSKAVAESNCKRRSKLYNLQIYKMKWILLWTMIRK